MAGAVACAAAVLVTGCGAGPVPVAAPDRVPGACSALVRALPRTVDGLARRDVEPAGAPAAAWGDPAVVLRCGVPEPAALTPASSCAEVNRVGWFAERRDAGFRFTTIGRRTTVQVLVPYDYEPAADALVDLAAPVRRSVPEVRPCV